MEHHVCVVITLLLAQSGAQSSSPQVVPRGHLTAVPLVAVQPAGEPFHRFSPPLSGRAPGLLISAGSWLTPRWGVEGEFTFGAAVSAPQQFSYNWVETYTVESRDLLGSFLVRWRRAGGRTLHVVAGAGMARSTVGQRDVVTTFPFSPGGPTQQRSAGWSQTTYGLQFTAGFDLNLRAHPRLAVVPAFRLRFVDRSNLEYAAYAGVDAVRYDLGVGVRAGF